MTPEELQRRVETLLAEHYRLHDRVVRLEEWADVVSSPLWKRIWFWASGWRWRTLGRWRGADTSKWPPDCSTWMKP